MRKDKADDSNIPKSTLWLLALWIVLVLGTLVWGVGNAETTLLEDARRSLAEDGRNVAVDFSGRDARLIGTVSSRDIADEIAADIDGLPGVRLVDNGLEVIEPPPPIIHDPEVAVRIIGDAVSVRGVVSSSELETELVEAAGAQFGADQVVNSLVVAEDTETPPWVGRIRDLFPHIGELRSGGFTATDTGFEISGEVISEAIRLQMIQEITLILDETIPFASSLTIATLPAPSFSATGSEGAVTLQGTVPNQETFDQIADAARRLHAGATIVNGLDVGEVAGSMWLELVGGLLDVVSRLDPWSLDIDDGNLTITGLAPDADLAAAVDVLAREVAAGQLAVTTDVQVDPAAVAVQLTNLLKGSATFETNEIALSAEGAALLDTAIGMLQANPFAAVIVAGYTDDEGDAATNLLLSQQRAEAVVAYLTAGGVNGERLTAIGYGEEDPIADNSTEEGRAQNRRIEFVIQQGDG